MLACLDGASHAPFDALALQQALDHWQARPRAAQHSLQRTTRQPTAPTTVVATQRPSLPAASATTVATSASVSSTPPMSAARALTARYPHAPGFRAHFAPKRRVRPPSPPATTTAPLNQPPQSPPPPPSAAVVLTAALESAAGPVLSAAKRSAQRWQRVLQRHAQSEAKAGAGAGHRRRARVSAGQAHAHAEEMAKVKFLKNLSLVCTHRAMRTSDLPSP
jgi:hypothetical protein